MHEIVFSLFLIDIEITEMVLISFCVTKSPLLVMCRAGV